MAAKLAGKVALVTGATRNIGLEIAKGLALAGASVGIHGGSDGDALVAAVDEISGTGAAVAGTLGDLADPRTPQRCIDEIESQLGPIDILVNNGAIRSAVPFGILTVEEWDRTIAVNLRAPFLFTRRLIPAMVERGWGRIVNISGLGLNGGSGQSVHVGASKAGLAGLTTAFAAVTAPTEVTVNTMMLGYVDTDRGPTTEASASELEARIQAAVPMGRAARFEEIVAVGLFLVSQEASHVTGQTVVVSGGASPLASRFQ